eukprot:gene36066-46877_t
MATVKKTNRGEYSNSNERMDELLGSLADLILEIGADQAKQPRKLPSGAIDLNDTTKRQLERIERIQKIKKLESEDLVKEHAAKTKKRNRMAARQLEDPNNVYEVPDDFFDDAEECVDPSAVYEAEGGDFADDPDEIKYEDEDDEEAVVEKHFSKGEKSSSSSKTAQPRTRNIRSKAELEKNDDEDFLINIKAISASRASHSSSSATPSLSVT